MAKRKKKKGLRKLSQKPSTVAYRELYRLDPDFRESEKARVRARYIPRPRTDTYNIKGRVYVTVNRCAAILGIKPSQLRYMVYKKVVMTEKLSNNQYAFALEYVHFIREHMVRFLDRPELETIERYNLRSLKDYLDKNCDKYPPLKSQETETVL